MVKAVVRRIRRAVGTASAPEAPATAVLIGEMPKHCPATLAGKRVTVRRSKTDQKGLGQKFAIPRGYRLRPVEVVETWLARAEISGGPVFRSAQPALLIAHSRSTANVWFWELLSGRSMANIGRQEQMGGCLPNPAIQAAIPNRPPAGRT